jgi:hypothetical protein
LENFKAFYKLFSTHTHSSPTAIKNIVANRIYEEGDFIEYIFLDIAFGYVNSYISYLILSVGKLWDIEFNNQESKKLLEHYFKQL